MKRRRLLAALAAGSTVGLAGCGYAYGGGDVRDEAAVRPRGLTGGDPMYAFAADSIAAARNGRTHDHDRGEFREATLVAVADRRGRRRWSYTHWTESVAVAYGNALYLLDERERVVAVDTVTFEDDRGVERTEPREVWRVAPPSPRPPIAADARGAYVHTADGVAAIRNGDVIWRAAVPGAVETIESVAGDVLVRTPEAVVLFDHGGEERFRHDGESSGAGFHDGRIFLARDGSVEAFDADGGGRHWSRDIDGAIRTLRVEDGTAYVLVGSRVAAVEGGDLAWTTTGKVRLTEAFVPSPEGVYAVPDGCRVTAVDPDGVRWTRSVDVDDCTVVEGWLDGETVAFLFDSGDLRRLQRVDQNPGWV